MTIGQVVGWASLVIIIIAGVTLFYAAYRNIRRMQRLADDAKKEYERFKYATVPCDKCLGSGRAPREGREWSAEQIARFKEDVAIENIPKEFRDAFKD